MQKKVYILLIIAAISSISWCIYRDIKIEKQYTGDLRNRIVGARLQKDGISPYFYKWKNKDGIKYYDPQNFDSLKVSNITSTPFFHELLYPLTDLPQREISKIWLAISYLIFFTLFFLFFRLAEFPAQKIMVIVTASLFLYSQGWIGHITQGQSYLVIPLLFTLFYFLNKSSGYISGFLSGTVAAMMLLIRPTTAFFLLPFLPFFKVLSLKHKIVFIIPMLLICFYTFSSSQKISYWTNYTQAMEEQLKSHQGLSPAVQHNDPDPRFQEFEGWNFNEVNKEAINFPFTFAKEHSNAFIFINHIFKKKTPVLILSLIMLAGMFLFALFVYRKKIHSSQYDLNLTTLLAFALYIISDIFSPIYRSQYYVSQWLFPLLLIASLFQKKYVWIYMGLCIGLLLNSVSLPFIQMENTLGEYLIFLFLIIYICKYKPKTSS